METTGGGVPKVSYTLADGMLLSQTQHPSNTTSFYLNDGQHSVRALTDAMGDISDSYDYTAFGELYASTGSSENHYLYTGQQFDALTGLYDLRARYYDPQRGRFLSKDTYPYDFQNPIELNRYGYTANNPINGSDPSGYLELTEYQKTVGAVVLAGAVLTAATLITTGQYTAVVTALRNLEVYTPTGDDDCGDEGTDAGGNKGTGEQGGEGSGSQAGESPDPFISPAPAPAPAPVPCKKPGNRGPGGWWDRALLIAIVAGYTLAEELADIAVDYLNDSEGDFEGENEGENDPQDNTDKKDCDEGQVYNPTAEECEDNDYEFVGFHGTSTKAESKLLVGDFSDVPYGANTPGREPQLGKGIYVVEASSQFDDNALGLAQYFAIIAAQETQSRAVVLKVYAHKFSKMIGKNVPPADWGEIPDNSPYITTYDYLRAPIQNRGGIQVKFNPGSYWALRFEG